MRLDPEACSRAVSSRDPRFDGLFFVGITTTRIYCRPVCPARVSYPERRRFFESAAAAERSGYRPCLRCRPELAPGRAQCDAVPRLARTAALRIAEGALNGQGVAALARELGVGERQLRRAMERELGVSPLELAQTHRLLLAKCLLTDTTLPVTRVAFSSGFQSLRRFNTVFRERYRMSPSALRRGSRAGVRRPAPAGRPPGELVRLTLSYRVPLAWEALLRQAERDAVPGVELVVEGRYVRTVCLEGHRGVVVLEHAAAGSGQIVLQVSASLLPALMPLLARLRHLLDLDAEPAVIDTHLAESGLAALVRRRPGLRLLGAFDGFEAATRELLGRSTAGAAAEPFESGVPGLTALALTPARAIALGAAGLCGLGVPAARNEPLVALARAVSAGRLSLEPGSDPEATAHRLGELTRLEARDATAIVRRALRWPDALIATDPELQRAAGARSAGDLLRIAERWRPWRAYAAAHLRLAAPSPQGKMPSCS